MTIRLPTLRKLGFNHGSFTNLWVREIQAFISELLRSTQSETGLVFSFDGAARSNPGHSASGVCAWWGTWVNDHFEEAGQILQRGRRLRSTTNNVAEAHGMAGPLLELAYLLMVILDKCAGALDKSVSLPF